MSVKSASEMDGLCDRRTKTTKDVAHRKGLLVLTRNFKKRGKRGASRSILNKASFNQPAMNMRRDILNKDPATRDYKCFYLCVDPKNWKEAINSDKFVEWERRALQSAHGGGRE